MSTKKIKLMKKLFHITYGANRNTLPRIYNSLIYSKLDYVLLQDIILLKLLLKPYKVPYSTFGEWGFLNLPNH